MQNRGDTPEPLRTYTTYVFDLDGTITDTTRVWLDIFRDCLKAFGVEAPDNKTLSGHTHDWKQMLELGLPEDKLEEFTALAHKFANERLPDSPLHPGALEMLQKLKASGKRVAIFSTMDRPLFEPTMQHRDLYDLCEAAVAGTDVAERKPKPDGILKALHDLGIPEEDYKNAVYIGDKDTDIQAAHNAGVDAILYFPPSHQAIYDREAVMAHNPSAVISDWQELLQSLGTVSANV